MKQFVSLILLIWSVLLGRVVDPLVDAAQTSLEEASEDADSLDERWEDLGVSTQVADPVEAISDVGRLSLRLPHELGAALRRVASGDPICDGPTAESRTGEFTVLRGNEIVVSPVVGEKSGWEQNRMCPTELIIANDADWSEVNEFYVTVLLIARDGERVGRYTQCLCAEHLPVWVLPLPGPGDIRASWRGRVRITAHHDVLVEEEIHGSGLRMRVTVLNPCAPSGLGSMRTYGD